LITSLFVARFLTWASTSCSSFFLASAIYLSKASSAVLKASRRFSKRPPFFCISFLALMNSSWSLYLTFKNIMRFKLD